MNEEDRRFGQPHHGHPDEDMMKKPAPDDEAVPPMAGAKYWRNIAQQLVDAAERNGFIITIERVPLQPLAMRNHKAHVEVREKR